MSVDFVARALARQQQQSGQGQAFGALATEIAGAQIPAGVNTIRTSGYATAGHGAGTYVADALATAQLAAAHPRFCKADAGGRYWRLLPDDQGLIPVACGGELGTQSVPISYDKLTQFADLADGGVFHLANCTTAASDLWVPTVFSTASILATFVPVSSTLAVSGSDVVMTATATAGAQIYRHDAGHRKISAVVKAGTAPHAFIVVVHPDSSVSDAIFDLNAGTVLLDQIGNATITSVGGGYYRIEVIADVAQYSFGPTNSAVADYAVASGSTLYFQSITISLPEAGILMTSTGTNTTFVWRDEPGLLKMSAVVKAGTAPYVFIASTHIDSTQRWANFDLTAGTVTFDTYGNATITPLGGGYFRIEAIDNMTTYAIGVGTTNDDSRGSAVGITAYFQSISISKNLGPDWVDVRGGIQAAIDYCEAIGAQGTRYDDPHYALWRVSRDVSAPADAHINKSGLLLSTTKSHKFISTCGGTTLWRRDTDGSAMGIAKFDRRTGYYWRGGGIFVEGQTTVPADPSENSIYLYDIVLDGGITDSSEENNPFGANMNTDGDGWDVTDKGIWQSNDRYTGNIVLEGRSGIRYFMGELIYNSGVSSSIADRIISIGPDVDIGHTCGSCINGNGATMHIERCRLHNAYMGVEGWTGHAGGYFKAIISDCNRNSIQGGTPHFGSSGYYEKTRPVATQLPLGHLDVLLRKAGDFEVGSWLYGKIEAIDCVPTLGNNTAFPTGCQDVDLEITTWADQGGIAAVATLAGGSPGYLSFDRVSLVLNAKRTDHAAANGYGVGRLFFAYGAFGPDVVVTTHTPVSLVAPGATITDNYIRIIGARPMVGGWGSNYFDIEANNNSTYNIGYYGNAMGLFANHSGRYNLNLPTTGVPAGYRLILYNVTGNVGASGVVACIPGSNMRGGMDLLIPDYGYAFAELEYDGQLWFAINAPPPVKASASWDPASVAPGAAVTTTMTAYGAVLGDMIDASFSNSLQGLVLSAYVSAANTVTVSLFNPTASAINLASGTLAVTIR